MKKSRFTDSQIIAVLKQAEAGAPAPDRSSRLPCRRFSRHHRKRQARRMAGLYVMELENCFQVMSAGSNSTNVPEQAASMPSE